MAKKVFSRPGGIIVVAMWILIALPLVMALGVVMAPAPERGEGLASGWWIIGAAICVLALEKAWPTMRRALLACGVPDWMFTHNWRSSVGLSFLMAAGLTTFSVVFESGTDGVQAWPAPLQFLTFFATYIALFLALPGAWRMWKERRRG